MGLRKFLAENLFRGVDPSGLPHWDFIAQISMTFSELKDIK